MDYTGIRSFSDFFQSVSVGLSSTRGQQRLIVFLIVIFVLISAAVYLIQRFVGKQRAVREAETAFRNSIKNVDFTDEELDILEKLMQIQPDGREKKYLLVQDAVYFSIAAERLLAARKVEPILLRRLRQKLDVCCFRREKKLVSTKELPEGLHVYIITTTIEGYHGTLVQQKHDFFAIKLKETAEELQKGVTCSVFFKRRKDTHRVTSRIKYRKNELIYIAHGQEIEKVRKRIYYRKQTSMEIALRKEGLEAAIFRTKLSDIGGGGAKLISPGPIFNEHDAVTLMLEFDADERVQIPGEIIRLSQKEDTHFLHVQFYPMKERQQERFEALIYGEKKEGEGKNQEKTETGKPAAKKPAAKKPATGKPAAKKPVSG